MTKKTGFFVLFVFVFITGTAHIAAMELEQEKPKPNSPITKVLTAERASV